MQKREMLQAFAVGAIGYPVLELLWRRRTHVSMSIAGGACFLGLYRIHASKRPFVSRCFRGALLITGVEFLTGVLVNKVLRLAVWDYSNQKVHVWGQICAKYAALWFALSALVSPLCKRMRVYNSR